MRELRSRETIDAMRVIMIVFLLSGCSWIFMEKPPETTRRGQPIHCTATKGFVAWDGLFVVVDALAIIANVASRQPMGTNTDTLNALLAVNVIDGLFHMASAFTGSGWADECREMRAQHEGNGDQLTGTGTLVTFTPKPKPVSDERRTVTGTRPVFCASTAPDIGECFTSEKACTDGLASLPEGTACEQKTAASCFNATKTLDGTRLGVCAVSIKDCEARREKIASDPDYTATACGIYRVETR